MENKEFFISKTKFKSYIKALLDFENLIKDYYNNKIKDKKTILIKDAGYLIDKKIFEKLKEELSYSKFKTYISEEPEFNKKLKEKYGNSSHIKIICFEQKIFTFKELLANLSKGNEYIIINTELWKKFNNRRYKENEGKICYEINEINIILILDGEKIYFKHDFNIIKSCDLLSRIGTQVSKYNGEGSSNYQHPKMAVDINKNLESKENLIVELFSSLIEYNNFQNFLINKLKEENKDDNNDKIIEGYFIENDWFQKWKQYTDYDNNIYLLNDFIENKNKIKNNIKNNCKKDLKEITIIKYFSEDELNIVLKTDLILVREDFVKIFEKETNDIKKYKIFFTIRNHELIFFNDNKKQISNIYSINNILPIESHKSFLISNHLIELYIFQEQLKLRIRQGKKSEKENLILVDKNFMNNFKAKYSYYKLCDSITNIEIIKNKINKLEKNDDISHYILNDIIKDFNWDYFYDIYDVNIEDNNDNYILKYVYYNLDEFNKNIKYLDNIELMDINTFNKLNLKEEIKNKISKKILEYYFVDNKILIKYESLNNNEIYIIGYIQDNNTFISEYYIESLDSSALKYHLSKNKISTLLKRNDNNIKLNNSNKTIGKLFPMNKSKPNNKNNNIDDYIKILLGIYNNYEYIKNKANKNFQKEQQFEIGYIVNQKYINKIKEILNYKEFCKLKLKEKEINKIIEEIKNDFSCKHFLNSLNYIDKKNFKDIKDDDELTEIKKINLKMEGLYYYKDLEIITNDLYKIFEEEHLTLKEEKMIKTKCLFGENKIIFYQYFSSVNVVIVAGINHNNKFNNELVLYFDNCIFLDYYIKVIQKNGYDKTILKLKFNNHEEQIFIESKNITIGTAYKIFEKDDIKLSREMEDEIFILIKIYLFNLDLKNDIFLTQEHADITRYEKYIKTYKCYLINKEWMDEFKKYYLYDELNNYLNKKEIKEKLDIDIYTQNNNKKMKKNYNEINVNKIFEEIKNNADFFKNYYKKEPKLIDGKLLDLKLTNLSDENNKKIYYYNGFGLINSDLKTSIMVNKYNKNIGDNEFIINMGRIIILLNYHPFSQLLIGCIKEETNFYPLNLIHFEDNNELNNYYLKFKKINFQRIERELKEDNNKIYDKNHKREVGILFNLEKRNEKKRSHQK